MYLSISLSLYSIRLRTDTTYIQTKTVAFNYQPCWTGLLLSPRQVLDELSPRKRSCLVVDATQSLGVVPIDVKAAGIDWLVPRTFKKNMTKQRRGVLAQVTFFFWLEALSNMLPRWCSSARGLGQHAISNSHLWGMLRTQVALWALWHVISISVLFDGKVLALGIGVSVYYPSWG